MKRNNSSILHIGLMLFTGLFISSCEINPVEDPNNPSLEVISANASLSEIQNVVDGSEAGMRDQLNQYFDGVSVIGREWYRFSGSDPRFTSDLLGKGNAGLDANTFYTTLPFAARYRVIRNLNILIDALNNSSAITDANQKRAGVAYAKTLQAYQLLMVENMQWENGIRVDVKNPDVLGPFLSRAASFDAIAGLLNEAYPDLANSSVAFPFSSTLSIRNISQDTAPPGPAQFAQLNRALAARVNVYRADWAGALSALNQSFFQLNGDLYLGVYHIYSTAGGDLLNPVYVTPNTSGETRVAHPDFINDAEPGDQRLNKVSLRTDTAFQDGLTSYYDVAVYKSNVDPVAIIRNEELILIYAEIKAQTGDAGESVNAINIIRNKAGLGNYTGGTTLPDLINEILNQRRYSLYGEGHRWIDMRRYNKLNELPIDRPEDNVWLQFPRPATEP